MSPLVCHPVLQELANILLGAARLGYDHDHQLIHVLLSAFVRHPGPFKPQVSGSGTPTDGKSGGVVEACASAAAWLQTVVVRQGNTPGLPAAREIANRQNASDWGQAARFTAKGLHPSLLATA